MNDSLLLLKLSKSEAHEINLNIEKNIIFFLHYAGKADLTG